MYLVELKGVLTFPNFHLKYVSIFVSAGIEARGFIFGPPIALAIGAKFVPLRKPGKLPGKPEFPYNYILHIMLCLDYVA